MMSIAPRSFSSIISKVKTISSSEQMVFTLGQLQDYRVGTIVTTPEVYKETNHVSVSNQFNRIANIPTSYFELEAVIQEERGFLLESNESLNSSFNGVSSDLLRSTTIKPGNSRPKSHIQDDREQTKLSKVSSRSSWSATCKVKRFVSAKFRNKKRGKNRFLSRSTQGTLRKRKKNFINSRFRFPIRSLWYGKVKAKSSFRFNSKSKRRKPSKLINRNKRTLKIKKIKRTKKKNGKFFALSGKPNSSQTALVSRSSGTGTWTRGLNRAVLPSYRAIQRTTQLFSLLAGVPVRIYRVNSLSLTRYTIDFNATNEKKQNVILNNSSKGTNLYSQSASRLVSHPDPFQVKTSVYTQDYKSCRRLESRLLLTTLERERNSRFQFAAIYVRDLVRVSFASRYLKKAGFLAQFYAYALSNLPRNRKETQFLRFLRKLLKVFSAQRKERLGIRIRFQGRVNRWNRTKHRVGEKGRVPVYTYSSRIEYGSAQAITRKGSLGIRIWLCYDPSFQKDFSRTLKSYLKK